MEKAIKSVNAERITIGILLNHPEWMVELNGLLRAEYYFLKGHKTLFYIIFALMKDGVERIDAMAIMARAEKINKAVDVINENGGMEYLDELKYLAEDYKLDDLKRYADEVSNASFKRDLLAMQDSVYKELYDNPSLTVSEINIMLQEKQLEVINRYYSSKQIAFIGDVLDATWKEIVDMRTDNGYVGLPSKILLVNRYFTYMNGELVVLGARAKYGKSNFAMNEAWNLASNYNIPCALFDTEMKTRIFLVRLLALDSGVPTKMIMSGAYEKDVDMLMAVESSRERIRKAPILHKYDPYWDRAKVAQEAKLLKLRHNLGFLVYDYIKVKEVGGGQGVKEHNELGNWTIFLKDLAGDLDIPILSFAQLSPHERRLADSDKLNRYASTIGYLLPKSPEEISRDFGAENGGTDMIFVDYNRNGAMMSDPSKGINLTYDRNMSKFEQAPHQILDDEYQ